MKKIGYYLFFFVFTLIIGNSSFAKATNWSISGLTAVFGSVTYSDNHQKFGWDQQIISTYKTSGDRELQMSVFKEDGSTAGNWIWTTFKSGTTKYCTSSACEAPSSVGNDFQLGVRLALPWVSCTIENGNWYLD